MMKEIIKTDVITQEKPYNDYEKRKTVLISKCGLSNHCYYFKVD